MTALPVWDHWDAMVAASRNVLGCDDEAHDCAAEAMTQVLEREPAGVVNLEAFMVTIAKRRALDRLRARLLAAQVPLAAPDVAEDIAARAEAAWADDQAKHLLKPHVYRLVRLLADGVPMQAAAEELGLTARSAESHLLRARRTVRKAMAQTMVVIGAAFTCGRKIVPVASPAAVAVALAAATSVLVAGPDPTPSEATAPPVRVINTGNGPSAATAVAAASAPVPAQKKAISKPSAPVEQAPRTSRAAAPAPARTTIVQTPVAGVDTYETDDGHQSDGPVEMVLHCAENLTVTVGHQGC